MRILITVLLTLLAAHSPLLAEAPSCTDTGTLLMAERAPIKFVGLVCNDNDFDIAEVSIVTPPSLGVLSTPVVGFGTWDTVYEPTPGATGVDTFTFEARDPSDDSNLATGTIDIRPLPHGGLWQSDSNEACFSDIAGNSNACTVTSNSLYSQRLMRMSPDGQNIYLITSAYEGLDIDSNVLTVLRRSPATGAITQPAGTLGCFSKTGDTDGNPGDECTALPVLEGLEDIAISPDSNFVYVSAADTSAIVYFSRDSETGVLTYEGCVSADAATDGFGCQQGHSTSLQDPYGLAFSPDGSILYQSSATRAAIGIMHRNSQTGALTQPNTTAGCMSTSEGTCASGIGSGPLQGARLFIPPDGAHLYSVSAGYIGTFIRNEGGSLSNPSFGSDCMNNGVAEGCSAPRNTMFAASSVMSPDGNKLYMAGMEGLAAFSRNPSTGFISQLGGTSGCINSSGADGCLNRSNYSSLGGTAISPDGKNLYVMFNNGPSTGDLYSLSIDHSTGALSALEAPFSCVSSMGECMYPRGSSFSGPVASAISPNGDHLYISLNDSSNAVYVFHRNRTPSCSAASASTQQGQAVSVPLSCSDSDSDAVSIEIVATPAHGSLGSVVEGQVSYQPDLSFVGSDVFSFRASDGSAGETQTATVFVLAPTPTVTPTATAIVTPTSTVMPTPSVALNVVQGVVLFNGSPLSGATVTCEGLGTVVTDEHGRFSCGTSNRPLAVYISKAGYDFPTSSVHWQQGALEFTANAVSTPRPECNRTSLDSRKRSILRNLLRLTQGAGRALLARRGRTSSKIPLARISASAFRQYRATLRTSVALPGFTEVCPSSVTGCTTTKTEPAKRSILSRVSRIAGVGRSHLSKTTDPTLRSSVRKSLRQSERRVRSSIRKVPGSARKCS